MGRQVAVALVTVGALLLASGVAGLLDVPLPWILVGDGGFLIGFGLVAINVDGT